MDSLALREYDFLEGFPLLFTGVNLFFAIFCSIWLIVLFYRRRFLFIKPSVLTLAFTHIFFQWPLVLFSGFAYYFLPNPIHIQLLVHTYMVAGLFFSTILWNGTADGLNRELGIKDEGAQLTRYVLVVLLIEVFFLFFYFIYTPPTTTGLYAVLFDPANVDKARHHSFFGLPIFMRYGLTAMQNVVAPVAMGLVFLKTKDVVKTKHYGSVPILLVAVILTVVIAGITGARYPIGKAVLGGIFAIWYNSSMRISVPALVVGLLAVFVPAALITFVREGREFQLGLFAWYVYNGIIYHRVLCVPLQVGLWHMQYVQLGDLFGVAGIPKLAKLLGEDAVRVPEIIGGYFVPNSDIVTHSNVGYLFAYYSYFGIYIIPVLVALLVFSDVVLVFLKRLKGCALPACLGALSVSVLQFIQSDFLTVLITHGFILTPLFCLLLQGIVGKRI